jgi:hypothetical protein
MGFYIPATALKDPTKVTWDWSTAGQDLPEDHYTYLKINGSFVYENNYQPRSNELAAYFRIQSASTCRFRHPRPSVGEEKWQISFPSWDSTWDENWTQGYCSSGGHIGYWHS